MAAHFSCIVPHNPRMNCVGIVRRVPTFCDIVSNCRVHDFDFDENNYLVVFCVFSPICCRRNRLGTHGNIVIIWIFIIKEWPFVV